MIDYADSLTKKSEILDKKKESVLSIHIPFPQLAFAILVAVFIYILGYQNNTIAQAKHDINLKKSKLFELQMTVNDLMLKKAKLFNSESVMASCESKHLNMADSDKIQIVR